MRPHNPLILTINSGIGEHAPVIRSRICEGLEFLGIELESKANAAGDSVISTTPSRVVVRVIPADEGLMIARSVCTVITKLRCP